MNKQILTKELEVISKCIENGITIDNKELIRRGVFCLRIITNVLAAEEPSAEKELPSQKNTDRLYSHCNYEKNSIDSLVNFINSSTGEFNAENITEVRACNLINPLKPNFRVLCIQFRDTLKKNWNLKL